METLRLALGAFLSSLDLPIVFIGLAGVLVVAGSRAMVVESAGRERAADLPPPAWRHVWRLVGVMSIACRPLVPMRLRLRVARRRTMARQLPFLLDLITLGVESGLNPSAAITLAVAHAPAGAMRDELARVLRDVRAGRPRGEALRLLAERTETPGVASFAAAMLSAERQGLALGPLLRAQAQQRRSERFLQAEKRAMEAPVKLLLPLVAFIFPGTFAVLLFPIAMQLLREGLF